MHLLEASAEAEQCEAEGKRLERSLSLVRGQFEGAFNNAPIGMALTAMDGSWLEVNDAFCRTTGYTSEELRATTFRALTHPEDVDLDAQATDQLLAGYLPSFQIEKRYRHARGHYVWVLATTSVVRGVDRRPLYTVTQVQDISERIELARHLEFVVDHDFLTGLFNRRYFEQELAREIERAARYGSPGAVLLIDIDNFKVVNDTFGHRAGDEVLKAVAGQLKQRLRQTDTVARLGGDEFAVLLTQTDPDQVQVVADQVVKVLRQGADMPPDPAVRITASVGVAMIKNLGNLEVLAFADWAMYEAKATGRNCFEMYWPLVCDPDLNASAAPRELSDSHGLRGRWIAPQGPGTHRQLSGNRQEGCGPVRY